jgi:hypothetical protein
MTNNAERGKRWTTVSNKRHKRVKDMRRNTYLQPPTAHLRLISIPSSPVPFLFTNTLRKNPIPESILSHS